MIIVLVVLLLLCSTSSTRAIDDPPFTSTGTFEAESAGLYTEYRYEYDWYAWQGIVNDPDTSLLILNEYYAEPVLADHYNQDFAELFCVESGDIGKFVLSDGDTYYYVCTGVYDGYNNGPDIRFMDGTTATDPSAGRRCDLLCYTCDHSLPVADGVRIVTWNRCERPNAWPFATLTEIKQYER